MKFKIQHNHKGHFLPLIKFTFILIFFVQIFSFTSCVNSKQIKYFQATSQDSTTIKTNESEYTIQPLDLLYIKVNSLNEKTMLFFEPSTNKGGYLQNEQSLYLSGFEVDINGYLSLPYIDSLYVVGKTISEVKNMVTEKLKEYVSDAIVNIRLISFKVCVFGEVQNAGTYPFFKSRVTIFDAIAAARPTDFANKKDVIITRLMANGELKVDHIDLTQKDIVKSDYYYLKPHDQIYFKPLKIKQYGFINTPYTLILSVISISFFIYTNTK